MCPASLPFPGHGDPRLADQTYLVGIDIGGTNLRCALVTADAPTTILTRTEARTPATSEAVVDLLADMVAKSVEQADVSPDRVAGIGCVTPGILDTKTGIVATAVNLGWTDVPLRAMLADRTGLPVAIENDVNAGAMAEYRFGEPGPVHSLVYLTVSTGLACGIVIGGRVHYGAGSAAGELGFLSADLSALDDPRRSLEHLAGGAGVARAWEHILAVRANGDGAPTFAASAVDVYDAAREGHPEAQRLVAEATAGIALAAATVCCVLNPEVLVLGGSIAEHEPVVEARVRSHLTATLPFAPRIERARLGKDAPLLGAIAVAERLARQDTVPEGSPGA